MNEKILKYLIYIWGAISLYAFIAIRFEPLFNGVLKENVVEGYWDKTKYGELYYFSMIRHFREEGLPPAQGKFEHSEKQSSVEDCEILVFGDSYFEFSRHKQFPEKLADDFDKKVHYVNHDFPLQYLAENNYKGSTPKLVLFERVERFIPVAFKEQHIIPEEPVVQSDAFQPLKYIREKLFYHSSEELYDAMLKRSYLSTGIYSLFVTWKFDLYGNMSGKTPAYLKDGSNSWLFYHDQVNETRTSFYYQHTDEQIDSICDHMENLSEQLLEEYNMQLLFLPLPAKYTLYHGLINDDPYNEFLPRLYEGLQERGVKYIDVFDKYLESDTLLFYRTDSHWNQKGIDMAYKETLQFINSDSILNTFL
jgi:hypothetical protein